MSRSDAAQDIARRIVDEVVRDHDAADATRPAGPAEREGAPQPKHGSREAAADAEAGGRRPAGTSRPPGPADPTSVTTPAPEEPDRAASDKAATGDPEPSEADPEPSHAASGGSQPSDVRRDAANRGRTALDTMNDVASGVAAGAAETARTIVNSVVEAYERRRDQGDGQDAAAPDGRAPDEVAPDEVAPDEVAPDKGTPDQGAADATDGDEEREPEPATQDLVDLDAALRDGVLDPWALLPDEPPEQTGNGASAADDVRPLPSPWDAGDGLDEGRRYLAVLRSGDVVVMLQGAAYGPGRAGVWLPAGTGAGRHAPDADDVPGPGQGAGEGSDPDTARVPALAAATAGGEAAAPPPPTAPDQGWTGDAGGVTSRRRLTDGRAGHADGPDQTLKWTIAILAMVLGFGLTLGLGIAALNNTLDGEVNLWEGTTTDGTLVPAEPGPATEPPADGDPAAEQPQAPPPSAPPQQT